MEKSLRPVDEHDTEEYKGLLPSPAEMKLMRDSYKASKRSTEPCTDAFHSRPPIHSTSCHACSLMFLTALRCGVGQRMHGDLAALKDGLTYDDFLALVAMSYLLNLIQPSRCENQQHEEFLKSLTGSLDCAIDAWL